MVTFKSLHPDLMSLGAQSVSGDAPKMLDANGLSHDLHPRVGPLTMLSHNGATGRRRSRHDRWRDQRIKVSTLSLQ